jgi:hypothetical protein
MGKCGKKFKEKIYVVFKTKDGKFQNGTDVELITKPGLPISFSNLRLLNLSDKTFTKEFPKKNMFVSRYQIKQYNSPSVFFSTNYQIYEEDTNSTLLFTALDIFKSILFIRPDGKYTATVTGATGRFEGATKIVYNIYTDIKTKEIQFTYTVTGYRPKC